MKASIGKKVHIDIAGAKPYPVVLSKHQPHGSSTRQVFPLATWKRARIFGPTTALIVAQSHS